LIAAIHAANARGAVTILVPGSFHGDEVPRSAAGEWHALVPEGTRVIVRRVDVTVSLEHDAIVDADDAATGKRVAISNALKADPIVLVRGIPGLESGPIATALIDRAIDSAAPVPAQLGSETYRLSLRCAEAGAISGQRRQKCDLRLASGSLEQSLFVYSAFFEGEHRLWASEFPPRIAWAGDLDGDHRIDLLVDTSDHYNVSELRLYLSSGAKAGHLVREAARFRSTGC